MLAEDEREREQENLLAARTEVETRRMQQAKRHHLPIAIVAVN